MILIPCPAVQRAVAVSVLNNCLEQVIPKETGCAITDGSPAAQGGPHKTSASMLTQPLSGHLSGLCM